jgi:hypothetical protein
MGDFNLDGYPDIVVTLKNVANSTTKVYLMLGQDSG